MLHHQFIDSAKKQKKAIAVHDFTTGRILTYKETLIASLILTRYVKKMSRGAIGIMIPTSAGCILAKLAILMAGRTPVMINYATGADRNCLYAQKACDFKTIITSRNLLKKIQCPKIDGMVFIEDILASVTFLQKLLAATIAALPLPFIKGSVYGGNENDTAVILFTSGSEKDPKAVPLTHKNLTSNIDAVSTIFNFTAEDIFLCALPYFHAFGITTTLWLPLLIGSRLLTLADPLEFRKVCTIAREEKATFLLGTPAFFWGYLRKSEEGDFDSIKIALVGADKCPESLREAWKKKHEIVVLEGYGATECSPVISTNTLDFNRPGSVGKPIPGMKVRIENYETGAESPTGEDGRILVQGASVMTGYLNNFEQTSLHTRNGWYDTGDMGNIDEDGYLWHVGRLKRFVKIGGEMISLIKIEDLLDKFLPKEVECCVVEVPDARKGARLVAVVTAKVDEKTILKKMSKELPKLALPRTFLVWEQLPKMGSGKIDFRRIGEMAKEAVQS